VALVLNNSYTVPFYGVGREISDITVCLENILRQKPSVSSEHTKERSNAWGKIWVSLETVTVLVWHRDSSTGWRTSFPLEHW
jgi:hypothetical protein